ncbi:dimethylamine/trimethylamine dehydrogenase [Angulomicrobium tetraedrale]|uniref:Dimethylamine/trimethylamine dehydrogenase n=1 Tax=Ancylobacter tetraedralis TaxID=217068 RepID=A0A839ZBU0_9HYPH|nr:FAD-dependent oxidoreductase [Ancylobacter tetraedralis]MBB3772168.1 dimethylamine/trimethylamine dehydrogenase [Ancylobacter tetraedralis]
MARDSRYDVLFEPVRIGPVTAPNRFYQVPHASGMTNALPRVRAAFRETKAEGGWGVVCTGACSIDESSDDAPLPFATLWDRNDIHAHALTTEAAHRHGALAGVELWHGGASVMNRSSRLPPLSPSGIPWMATHVGFMGNLRPRTMDRADIREVLRWQAEGARKARTAGFDIVYVYAGMGYLGYEFLLPEYNHRTDEYGGPIENRVRFVREMLDVTRDAVGKDCGVALRVSLEELRGRPGRHHPSEAHELVAQLSDHADLFDVKMDSSPTDCSPSRFSGEGSHEPVIDFVKTLTDKPVVGVGRFTSPDMMVSQIRRGVLDFIGGARPSIADPFLPNKIREGRIEEIRECIGCNICISSWHDGVPVRCTQNPTAGEEWRRGWHPERVAPATRPGKVLVVGGGPAGLECALTSARQGHEVTIVDAGTSWGGRLTFEKTLPGLAAWNRVADYRLGRLNDMPNVSLYLDSRLGVDDIIEFAPDHLVLATGARWTRSLYSSMEIPVGKLEHENVFTPDDIAAGRLPEGPTLVFDFDNYYYGGVLTEHLASRGIEVAYVTPAGQASAWTIMTNELPLVHRALARRNVPVTTLHRLKDFDGDTATLAHLFTGEETKVACRAVLIVGLRAPRTELEEAIAARRGEIDAAGIRSLVTIGDALAPGAIAHAVHSGHLAARELGRSGSRAHYLRDTPITDREPAFDRAEAAE